MKGREKQSMHAHADFDSFTMLFQNSCGGLGVMGKEGKLVDANPIGYACVMNIGDYLMWWSNGELWVEILNLRRTQGLGEISSLLFFVLFTTPG